MTAEIADAESSGGSAALRNGDEWCVAKASGMADAATSDDDEDDGGGGTR